MPVTDTASTIARPLLQVGWLAKGLLFVVIGALAIAIASRSTSTPDEDADQTGALQALAEVAAGRMLVFAMAVGLFAYAAWNLWSAATAGHDGFVELASRVGRAGLAVVYGLLAETALQIAIDGGPPPQSGDDDGPTSPVGIAQRLFEVPAGRVAVVILGIGTAVVAAYHLWKGAAGDFLDDIDLDDIDSARRRALRVLGTIGFAARATVLAIAGWLFVDAAVRREADRAAGLDDALRSLRDAPLGTALLAIAGAGLVAAGLYDAITFRRQRFG